jgi:Protein of unknown function (DUF4239)
MSSSTFPNIASQHRWWNGTVVATLSYLATTISVDCLNCKRLYAFKPLTNIGTRSFTLQLIGENGDVASSDDELNQTNLHVKCRQRRPDYPSFAYRDKKNTSSDLKTAKKIMKFKNACGNEVVFNTGNDDEPNNNQQTTWLENAFQGTPLETAFNSIYESALKTRIRSNRSYARKEPFEVENIAVPPCSKDLATPPVDPATAFWISTPARILSFFSAFYAFPYIMHIVESLTTMPPSQLDEVSSKFGPGISILYGTFISLTLSILYNRIRTIQDSVGVECSFLAVVTRNLISLFRNNRERAIEAAQCSADQIRTLVRSSRGAELMLLVYSDPYARMVELIDNHEIESFDKFGYDGRSASLIGNCRDILKDLYKVRANRLSDEAVALPPTHFLILLSLTLLNLLGYIVSIIPTLDSSGNPPFESCLLFAVLSTIYTLFYNFASDLNNPFEGVYQIRRSLVASHLLQLKWLIANHPILRGEIDFDEMLDEEDGVQIYSPGLGDLWFERNDLFVNGDGEESIGSEGRVEISNEINFP